MSTHSSSLHLGPYARAAGQVTLPGSKSISNRVLLLAALCCGQTVVRHLLQSDDTAVMLAALRLLGVGVEDLGQNDYRVSGCGGRFPVRQADLFLGNAGTAFRPLTAVLALQQGHYTLRGVPRMHERPIGDLVDALRSLGARIDYVGAEGFPPLQVAPCEQRDVLRTCVRGDVSSQFLSALLLALPLLARPVTVEVSGTLISKPYVDISLNLLARFGVEVKRRDWREFTLAAAATTTGYRSPGTIRVEGDASSASYFLALGAIGGGPVTVQGVGRASIQGDVRFAEVLEIMGANVEMGEDWIAASASTQGKLRAIDADFNHIPDTAMTVAVLALFAEGATTLRNIASWRVKETDRIAAMATELRKLGARVEEGADYLRIIPPAALNENVAIDTYDDHRMAMCFSLVSLGGVPVTINDPACVAKTFPAYFDEFRKIVS